MKQTPNALLIYLGLIAFLIPFTCLFSIGHPYSYIPLTAGVISVMVGCLPMGVWGKRVCTTICLVAVFAITIYPILQMVPSREPGHPIVFVLPKDFRGEFAIVKNRSKGQDLRFENGAWIFEIPKSGTLIVEDDSPFYRWHTETFQFVGGNYSPVRKLGTWGITGEDGTTHKWIVENPPKTE